MILKIKSNDHRAKQSWRFIEDVTGLHFSVYADMDDYNNSPVSTGVQEIHFTSTDITPAVQDILFAAFYTESLGAVHLFCDTECYLLNDNGRTIERLI